MPYCLINGTRYYKDPVTGRLTIDNASQQEAERRTRLNQGRSYNNPSRQRTQPASSTSRRRTQPASNTSRRRTQPVNNTARRSLQSVNPPPSRGRISNPPVSRGFPWGWIIVICVIAAIIAAFVHNRISTSAEEQAIQKYMQQDAAENTAAVNTEPVVESQYLLPDSNTRYLDASELEAYSSSDKRMMINEIYARHGRVFTTQYNKDYFQAKEWYEPVEGKTDQEIINEFNEYEMANVNLLANSF